MAMNVSSIGHRPPPCMAAPGGRNNPWDVTVNRRKVLGIRCVRRPHAMRIVIAGLVACVALAHAACAATSDDVVRPIHQFIDGFNRGDTASGFAAYASGPVSIIDEFAPHLWVGPDAARTWAA